MNNYYGQEMFNYILEEPKILQRIYENRKTISEGFVKVFKNNPIKKVYFSGQASGMHIGNMVKPFFEKLMHIEVEVTNPAQFLEYQNFNINNVYRHSEMLLICPAHSGSTKGPIEMAKICRKENIPIICTTYNLDSELAKLSDVVILKDTGKEDSFIETKGHFASVCIFLICVIETAYAVDRINEGEYIKYCESFLALKDSCEIVISDTLKWYKINKSLIVSAGVLRVIGFGPYYAVAQEGSQKIAEATTIPTIAYEMEEFMHTSTTQIRTNSVIIIINPASKESNRMNDLLTWCRNYSSNCIMFSNGFNKKSDHLSLTSCFLDIEYLSVLEYLIPFQLIAHFAANDLGLSTIFPRNDGANEQLRTHVN